MKTHLKYVIVGLVVALLAVGTDASGMSSPIQNRVNPRSGEVPQIKIAREYCFHIPYSKAQIENSDDLEIIEVIARLAENSIPLSVLRGELIKTLFFDGGGNNSIACLYYPEN